MKKYFFSNVLETIIYFIFLCLIPLLSIIAQYCVSDKTLYVSFIVTGFAITYDYLMLFKGKPCKRLWIEAIFSAVCLVLCSGFGVIQLIFILLENKKLPYTIFDILIIVISLGIMFVINSIEMVLFFKYDYKKRFFDLEDTNEAYLMKGAKKSIRLF